MPPKSKRPRKRAPGLRPDAVSRRTDELPAALRRNNQREIPPDSLPDADEEEMPIAGRSPSPDGGVEEHPIHDEPEEDFTPGDYERQIDDLARTRRRRTSEKP